MEKGKRRKCNPGGVEVLFLVTLSVQWRPRISPCVFAVRIFLFTYLFTYLLILEFLLQCF